MTKADVRKEFGAAVRAYRQRLGISQETLAERADLHRTYVTDVERGARNLSLESISRLAGALELSISSLFFPTGSGRAGRGESGSRAHQSVDIVLVEDEEKDIKGTLEAFRTARVSNPVEVLRDGEAALDFLFARGTYARRRQAPPPLLVLLDLHLPKVDGVEVLRRVRKDPRTHTLQVVVLTNTRDADDADLALRLGAAACLIKPLNFKAFSSVTPQLNFGWTLLDQPAPASPATGSGGRSLKR